MNYNSSRYHEVGHVMYVSPHVVRSVIDARFWDFWPSDILRMCNTLSGAWAASSGLSGPITWGLRFADFGSERFRDYASTYSEFPRLPRGKRCGLRVRGTGRSGRAQDSATLHTAHWNSPGVLTLFRAFKLTSTSKGLVSCSVKTY